MCRSRPSIACSGFCVSKSNRRSTPKAPSCFRAKTASGSTALPKRSTASFSVFRRRRGCGQYQRRPVSDGFMRAFAASQLYITTGCYGHGAALSRRRVFRRAGAHRRAPERQHGHRVAVRGRSRGPDPGARKPGAYCGAVSAATRIEKARLPNSGSLAFIYFSFLQSQFLPHCAQLPVQPLPQQPPFFMARRQTRHAITAHTATMASRR